MQTDDARYLEAAEDLLSDPRHALTPKDRRALEKLARQLRKGAKA